MQLTLIKKIKGFEYLKIIYTETLPEEASGTCHYFENKLEIALTPHKTQKALESTILHELCHMIVYRSGWHHLLEEKGLSEEGLVTMLESQLGPAVTFIK